MNVAHPRVLRHPGPIAVERITACSATTAGSLRLELAAATRLDKAIIEPLAALGVETAVLTLLSGPWATLGYRKGVADPTGERVATYAPPEHVRDVLLIAGSATLGRGVDGGRLVHAHGSFTTAGGEVRGGHLVPDLCATGTAPTIAYVTVISGFAVAQTKDAETNHLIFSPVATGDRDG